VTPEQALATVAGGFKKSSSLDVALAFMDEKDAVAWRSLIDSGKYESYRQVARAVTLFLKENYGIDHVVSQNAIPRRDS
jgi:hypothetical protein